MLPSKSANVFTVSKLTRTMT